MPLVLREGDTLTDGEIIPGFELAVADAFRRIDPAFGRAARETVLERFTEARMIDGTVAAYARALGNV